MNIVNDKTKILLVIAILSCKSCSYTSFASDNDNGAVMKNEDLNHAKFADALTEELYMKEENECSSSLGISMAFSLIYPGSTGSSTEQIQSVLGFPQDATTSTLVWDATSDRLETAYQGDCFNQNSANYNYIRNRNRNCRYRKPLLQIANSIWVDTNTILAPTYQAVVGSYVHQIDFQDEGSPALINDWVQQETNGLIDSILEEGNRITYTMIAINTIYLKASWRDPFDESKTNVDAFYTNPSRESVAGDAHFMHKKFTNILYSQSALDGFQLLQMPFAQSELSMILVLPSSENAENIASTVSSSAALEVLPQLESTTVLVALPKFKFESQYSDRLKQALQSIGLEAPFEGDLCNITGTCDLFIDTIIQKTVIDVNEDGVEAAAASSITVNRMFLRDPPSSEIFMADHPFQFFIYDEREHLVIFEGQVVNPGIPMDSTGQPQLQSDHSDSDSWSTAFGLQNEEDRPIMLFDFFFP